MCGAYKYIQKEITVRYKERGEWYRKRLIAWRNSPSICRLERPSNIPRARGLGYKAKKGYVIVRAKVKKGRRKRPKPSGGRKPGKYYLYVQPQVSHQLIAEQRANRKYRNLEVLNSYWVGEDGNYKFFEVILVDPSLQQVKQRGRVFRGLTSSGRSARGL